MLGIRGCHGPPLRVGQGTSLLLSELPSRFGIGSVFLDGVLGLHAFNKKYLFNVLDFYLF